MGKRILVTQANEFMGPAICSVLAKHHADIVKYEGDLTDKESINKFVAESGKIDALIANLAIHAPSTPVGDVDANEWDTVFSSLVSPLPRLVGAVLPQMKARREGKIIVMGSASALRGMKRASTYSAARGAQLAYVQAAGTEIAQYNIQLNAIAQNFVDNPTYFPEEVQSNPKFVDRLKREVPLGRLVSAEEDAEFVAYLCSENANCFVGQIFPICGGWVQR